MVGAIDWPSKGVELGGDVDDMTLGHVAVALTGLEYTTQKMPMERDEPFLRSPGAVSFTVWWNKGARERDGGGGDDDGGGAAPFKGEEGQ